MKKAAIFDLDGTLADTILSIATAANNVLKELGLKEHAIKDYQYFAGDGAKVLVERALVAAGDVNLTQFERAYKNYQQQFETDCTYQVAVFDGIKEILEELKKRRIKIAVLTNKPQKRAEQVLNYLFGENYFDAIIGEEEGRKRKPDPEGAILLANQFGVKESECLYVGDTDVDMKTGKQAGMFTVGVLWGFRDYEELKQSGADVIIASPSELRSFLD